MKPKNKFQAEVVKVSHTLPAISTTQRKWAEKNLFTHIARVTKSGKVSCLECGAGWHNKDIVPPTALYDALLSETTVCPHCNTTLKVEQSRKRKLQQMEYLCVVTTHKGYQVLRFSEINAYYEVGKPAYYFHREVIQH